MLISIRILRSTRLLLTKRFLIWFKMFALDASINSPTLTQFLVPVVGNNAKWVLCYRATIHGWAASTFHNRCDGKPDTVTIITNGPYVFGGYTDVAWGNYFVCRSKCDKCPTYHARYRSLPYNYTRVCACSFSTHGLS